MGKGWYGWWGVINERGVRRWYKSVYVSGDRERKERGRDRLEREEEWEETEELHFQENYLAYIHTK